MSETINWDEFEIGETYSIDVLPDNDMDPTGGGKAEWVSDNLLALVTDGKLIEFEMAVECTAVCNVTERGDVEVIKGSTER